jgi:hypothetical protein
VAKCTADAANLTKTIKMGTLQLILICITVLTICIAAMAINIIVKKDGKFPDGEIGTNPNMRKLGIQCAKQEETMLWKKTKVDGDSITDGCYGCALTSVCETKGEKDC